MGDNKKLYKFLNLVIPMVWLINGLICKIINLVPRHREIVGRILGREYEKVLTILIGFGELFIFIWIISRIKPKVCAVFQIVLVATMNIIEFILVPDLLLFGRLNIIFAIIFMALIYVNSLPVGMHKKIPLN